MGHDRISIHVPGWKRDPDLVRETMRAGFRPDPFQTSTNWLNGSGDGAVAERLRSIGGLLSVEF